MNYLKLLFIIAPLTVSSPAFAQFFEEDHLITDVRNNIIWLRCSVGQTWDNEAKTCTGDLVKLNHDEIEVALQQASEQLGGEWRLPTLGCLLYTSPSPRDGLLSRMPSSA